MCFEAMDFQDSDLSLSTPLDALQASGLALPTHGGAWHFLFTSRAGFSMSLHKDFLYLGRRHGPLRGCVVIYGTPWHMVGLLQLPTMMPWACHVSHMKMHLQDKCHNWRVCSLSRSELPSLMAAPLFASTSSSARRRRCRSPGCDRLLGLCQSHCGKTASSIVSLHSAL